MIVLVVGQVYIGGEQGLSVPTPAGRFTFSSALLHFLQLPFFRLQEQSSFTRQFNKHINLPAHIPNMQLSAVFVSLSVLLGSAYAAPASRDTMPMTNNLAAAQGAVGAAYCKINLRSSLALAEELRSHD
jgi:hypothetical protein